MNELTSKELSFRTLVVTKKDQVGGRHLQFRVARSRQGGELPPFTAGAHLTVRVPSGANRNYSLCNDPDETDRYVIAVKRDAAGRGGSVSMTDDVVGGRPHRRLRAAQRVRSERARAQLRVRRGRHRHHADSLDDASSQGHRRPALQALLPHAQPGDDGVPRRTRRRRMEAACRRASRSRRPRAMRSISGPSSRSPAAARTCTAAARAR